jgi:hypothetical protein
MKARTGWPHTLVVVGLIVMLIGTIDPLEGSLIILPGSGIVALGASLGQSRHRRLFYWAFGSIAVGVGAMFVLSMFGGTGGRTGRSNWWSLVVLPYPIGWIMSLVGAILSFRERKLERMEEGSAASQ